MAANRSDDGRTGKEIGWSSVIPSITRLVWEPPALEILDAFKDDEHFTFDLNNDKMKAEYSGREGRLQL